MLYRQMTTKWMLDGKQVPAGTPGAEKRVTRSKKWYGRVKGKGKPLDANKARALQMLVKLRAEADDPDHEGRRRKAQSEKSLLTHADEFEAELRTLRSGKGGKPPGEQHVRKVMVYIRRIIAGCKITFPREIQHRDVSAFLHSLTVGTPVPTLPQGEEFSIADLVRVTGDRPVTIWRLMRRHGLPKGGMRCQGKTRWRIYPRETVERLLGLKRGIRGHGSRGIAEHAGEMKRFCAWLVKRQAMAANPLSDLEVTAHPDHRHERRALSPGEIQRLLATTLASSRKFRRLTGLDRWVIYLTTLATGFRRGEVASLRPAWFSFEESPPVVRLPDSLDKAGRKVSQPLPDKVIPPLREYLAGRPAQARIWPGAWWMAAADMQRADLAEADIPYATDGVDGPLFADFHALRHTFVAMLDRAGVTLKMAMQLARHSDPRLTARIYGQASSQEMGEALNRPGFTLPFTRSE